MTQHLKRLDEGIDEDTGNYYLGYRPADQDTRWAKYFNDTAVGLSQEFTSALESSPFPPGTGLNIQQAAQALSQPGYLQLENGFTVNDDGTMMLAIRTEQPPEFSGEMFDFWFSWHVNDTTKYKLWNPAQHQYAAIDNHFIADASTSQPYRERYWNITSFVDEWIGDTAYKLSIAFFDPRIMNFTLEDSTTGIETIIMGFVDLFRYTEEDPTSMAQAGAGGTDVVLAHQIRKKPDGSGMEMRSRFFFGDLITSGLALVDMRDQLAHDLSVHCAIEMGHVGSFLPALFEEFKDDIPTGV
ncbi:hypothetical protein N0V82_008146 [Gnomoniopsis sp. IMI 355080]|nr:hypothetical protein N0V82_008146 [Gnomoniopsis sp. IMI 355080]